MKREDVDDVVLVGGSSRIVKVQELLRNFFNGKNLCRSINPDEAVAYGAAIQAAMLSDIVNIKDFTLVDVIPLSLGIKLYTEEMRVVIPKNTTFPVKMFDDKLTTAEDDQESVTFYIYEGEQNIAKENIFLGKFELCGIPPAPKESHSFKVCFEIDNNGILTVSACLEGTNNKNQIVITHQRSRLSNEEIDRMIEEAKKYKAEDDKFKKVLKSKLELQDYAEQMRDALSNCKMAKKKLEIAMTAIENTLKWLDCNPTLNDARKFEDKMKTLQIIVNPIIADMKS